MTRVAAVCIDAGEWWYLQRLMAAGKLPNLARLHERSAAWTIRSEMAYRSELVWARFLTGREPIAERNWAACVTFDPDTYAVGNSTANTAPPFYAFGDGTKVVALDLIHSSTADGVDGVQVVGWGSHAPQWPRSSRPPGLLTEIDARFGINPAFGNDMDHGWANPPFIDAVSAASKVGGRRRVDIAEWLLAEHPDWELFLTSISELHGVGHQLWFAVDERHPLHGVAPTTAQAARRMDEVTVDVDDAIGRLLDLVGEDTTVVVFAMHGLQPSDDAAATLLLPELVHRLHLGAGLLRDPDQVVWRRNSFPPVLPGPGEHIGSYLADRFADSAKQRLRRALRGAVPGPVYDRMRRLGGRPPAPSLAAFDHPVPPETLAITDDDLAHFRRPPAYQPAYWYRRHWQRQPYFALPTFADGHLRVNLRGRERHGLVDREDYNRVLNDMETAMLACRDPRTGRPVVAELLRMRAEDPLDPHGADADLLVVFDGALDAIEHPAVGIVGPVPHLRTASHSADGFALIAGPGIQPGDLGMRPAADLPPTILALMGKPVPASMIGTSLLQPA